MEMQCGPLDRSLLNQQEDHISTAIWHGVDRNRLDVRQLTARQGDWVLQDSQRHLLDAWGFGVFAKPRSVPQNDIALITALVERWRPETNSFHFPFGEMTITLEDVYMILGLPIIGHAVTSTELDAPKAYWMRRWEDRRLQDTNREDLWSKRGGVGLAKLRERYGRMGKADEVGYMEQDPVVYTRAYIFYIIGGILFPTPSRDIVHPRYLQLIQTTDDIMGYAWGAAVLAYLYRGLCKAVNKSCTSLNGCTMLLQLWAYERLLPGRPEIAPGMERVWPRALAWSEHVAIRRFNPYHHTRQYRGNFDSFELHWLTWEPYARFYMPENYDQDDDDLHVACHMGLGRIPLIAFEICEYQMPDRVLRQFGIRQHIPEPPVDMGFLRTERASSFQRVNHVELLRTYVQEWDAYVATGMPITTEGPYVPIFEYMLWYKRVSKLRIAPFLASDPHLIQPRDWYPQEDMAYALESAMRMTHAMYLRGPPDWFYELIPDFLAHYDRVNTEWKGLTFDRPTFTRKEQPFDVGEQPSPIVEQPPVTVEQPPDTVEQSQMEIYPSAPGSSLQTPVPVSHKSPHDDTNIEKMSEYEKGASDSEVQLKVLIHKKEKKVVFAEANGAFVDILFSFLTLPMGTIVRVLTEHSEPSLPRPIGSFNTLYRSLANLETKYFATEACKDMLLNTRNSAEAECEKLKINIDEMKPYFICDCLFPFHGRNYASFSTSCTTKCQRCGKFLNVPIYINPGTNVGNKGVFVSDTASFLIQDDLKVIPSNLAVTLDILKSSGISDFGVLEEKTLQLGSIEILDLLENALFSKTCLTDMVFGKKCIISPVPSAQSHSSNADSVDNFKKMTVNVMVQKSKNKILLAHCSEDFVDLLFNFITVPLKRVISMLSTTNRPTLCAENIHLSVSELSVGEYLISQQMKDMLLEPQMAMIYQGSSQLFPPKEQMISKLYLNMIYFSPEQNSYRHIFPSDLGCELKFASPKGDGGLLKGSTKFMVTDDLVVTPLSSMCYIKYLQSWKVLQGDIEEQVIDIGMEEALNLLRESLVSSSVLTNGLKHLIWNKPDAERLLKKPKVEK